MFNIILLGITSLLTDISSEMVYPIIPIYLVTTLGVGPAILGVVEGIAESLASILKIFSGYFSDKTKSRKPLTIFGYSGSAVGKFILYLSSNWWYVLAARAVDRFGKGVRTAPRDALIAESAAAGKRGAAFGLHRAMDTAGAACGVLLAYFFVTRYKGNFKILFLWSIIPAVLAVAVLFFVREKKTTVQKIHAPIVFRWGTLDKRLRLFLIFSFLFTLGNSSNQFLLLRAKGIGNSLAVVILFYLVYNLVYAFVSYPAAYISDKIGRKTILTLGYLFYGLVYLGFAINKSPVSCWWLFALYGLYIGFTDGVEKALVIDMAPADSKATAIGLHAMLVGIGLLPASIIAGLLWKFLGAAAPFYFGGITGIVASIGIWLILKGV